MGRFACRSYCDDVAAELNKQLGITLPFARLLASRNITNADAARKFLSRNEVFLYSPFLISGMHAAVKRISSAIKNKEHIYLFSDSDLDGLTSLSIVRNLLERMDVLYTADYTTGEEGYGFSRRAVESAAAANATLVITLDCGVRDIAEIAEAKKRNIDVIVCDHHDPGDALPECIVVNPKCDESLYPYRDLAGCGVAFILSISLLYSYLPLFDREIILSEGESISVYKNMIFQRAADAADIKGKIVVSDEKAAADYSSATEIKSLSRLVGGAVQNIRSLGVDSHFLDDLPVSGQLVFSSLLSSRKIASFALEVLPFAAIGTIADLVPLLGANRTLVWMGLAAFEKSELPSVKKMTQIAGLPVDAKKISWRIAPLLNAPGRYGKTSLTADFLSGRNCDAMFERISELNKTRKDLLKTTIDSIDEHFLDGYQNIICALSESMHEGLTGLVASRISETGKKPAIAVSRVGENVLKGSGRAPDGFDLLSCAEGFASRLLKFGGHPQAFGFSIEENLLEEFLHHIDAAAANSVPSFDKAADCVIDVCEISRTLIRELSLLQPFGKNNDEPLFVSSSVPLERYTTFGVESVHGKVYCPSQGVEIIGWKMKEPMKEAFLSGSADLLYRLDENHFNGKVTLRIVLEDIFPSGENF